MSIIPISSLPSAPTVTQADIIPLDHSGTTYHATVAQILSAATPGLTVTNQTFVPAIPGSFASMTVLTTTNCFTGMIVALPSGGPQPIVVMINAITSGTTLLMQTLTLGSGTSSTSVAPGAVIAPGGLSVSSQLPGNDAATQAAIAALNPVHWYKFNETSGNFADSGSSPSAATTVSGVLNAGTQLLAGAKCLYLPYNVTTFALPFTLGSSAFTFGMLCRYSIVGLTGSQYVANLAGTNAGTGSSVGWSIVAYQGRIDMQWYPSFNLVPGPGADEGRTHLYIVSYDGTNFFHNVDGIQLSGITASGFTVGSNNIGFNAGGVFGMTLAHVFSLNSALTASQMATIAYAAGCLS